MNGRVASPWHRVILPKEGVRNSMVYFFYPKHDLPIAKNKIVNQTDLFGRGHKYFKVEFDDSFPKYLIRNKSLYNEWIL